MDKQNMIYRSYFNGYTLPKYSPARIYSVEAIARKLYYVTLNPLKTPVPPKPPQFMMVWVPGLEAIPLSIAHYEPYRIDFIVKTVGKTTKALVSRKSFIGVYGPLGKPLVPRRGDRYLFIAGGSGIAAITHYLQNLCREKHCETVYGGWSFEDIGRVPDYIERLNSIPITACLDKECDIRGAATDYLDVVDVSRYDYIVVCGPPGMIREATYKIPETLHGRVIVVLEATVKCGLGLCGSCRISEDHDLHLCIDGPGFYLDRVADIIREKTVVEEDNQ